MSPRRGTVVIVAAAMLTAANACTNWTEVKTKYCATQDAGEGDCEVDGGGPDAGPVGTFDGGPPVTWAIVRGGAQTDSLASFEVSPDGAELAISGAFVNAFDFGDGGVVQAQSPSGTGRFVARHRTSDGALIDGNAFRCGEDTYSTARLDMPLVYVDGGLVLGGLCWGSPGEVLDPYGNALAVDGGPTHGIDPFLFRMSAAGPQLQYLNTPESYEPEKGMVALARTNKAEFLMAANLPQGSAHLGLPTGADGGQTPVLARLDAGDLSPQIVDVFDCPGNALVRWENMVTDSTGDWVFALIDASENPPGAPQMCFVTIPGAFVSGSSGNFTPALHRWLFKLGAAGSAYSNMTGFGTVPQDGGTGETLHLVATGANSVYFAGEVERLWFAPDNISGLVVGNFDMLGLSVTALRQFRGGPSSEVAFNDLAVIPGVSPKIWVTGKVKGQLEQIDGGFVLASNDPASSDGFLMRLDPTTLAPAQTIVFGNPGFSEEGRRLVLRPPDLYVAGTVSISGGSLPYVFGGKSAPLIGGRDVLFFKMPIPP